MSAKFSPSCPGIMQQGGPPVIMPKPTCSPNGTLVTSTVFLVKGNSTSYVLVPLLSSLLLDRNA